MDDQNQTQDPTMNPAPAADPGMGTPVVDPNAGVQTPVEPTMPAAPADPVAPVVPEPTATPAPDPVAPVAPEPVEPVMPEPAAPAEGGDMGGGQMPPATTPPTV